MSVYRCYYCSYFSSSHHILTLKSPMNDTMKKYIIFNEVAKSFRTSFSQNTSLVASSRIWFLLISNFLKYSLLKSLKTHCPIFWAVQFLKSFKFDKFGKHVLTWFLVDKLLFFYPFKTIVSFTWKIAKRFHFKSSQWWLYD